MSFADECSDDSSSDEFLDQCKNRPQWSHVADKLRDLLINNNCTAIVDFLETFLKFVRNGPKDSRKFTRSISKYLFATKNVISNETVEQSYYVKIKNILAIYCALELRLINCLDDESAVASTIITTIFLLMQGSESVTILDVLVDIDEIIRSSRSKSVMAIVYRHFLTSASAGQPPRILDDTSFIKHLILYRSWYNAEVLASEKVNVFKWFSSTIKPTEELRTNQSYSLLGIDEQIDFKKLLQQKLPQYALIRALRDAETSDDCQFDAANTTPLDESMDVTSDAETAIKVEVDLSLNLPDETILVDDEDDIDDMGTVSYLPNLFERLVAIDECEWRVALLQHSHQYHLESSSVRTERKVTFGGVTTHFFERCDYDGSYSDESYGDDANSDESFIGDSSDVSDDADSFNKTSRSHSNSPDVKTTVDGTNHSSAPIEDKSERNRCDERKSRKKKRSHFRRPNARNSRTSIDAWMKRKKLATTHPSGNVCVPTHPSGNVCVPTHPSGNVCVPDGRVKNCSVRLTRLDNEGRISGNSTFGRCDSSDKSGPWHSKSSTTLGNHYTLSESVFKAVSTTSSAHNVSTVSKSEVSSTRRVLLPVNSEALKNCQELGLRNCSLRLKRFRDERLEKKRKCKHLEGTISTRSSTSHSKSSRSAESTRDCQPKCTFEYVDCDNDIPSPVYSPYKGKRKQKNDKRYEPNTAVNPSPITFGFLKDDDEISAITRFIASTS